MLAPSQNQKRSFYTGIFEHFLTEKKLGNVCKHNIFDRPLPLQHRFCTKTCDFSRCSLVDSGLEMGCVCRSPLGGALCTLPTNRFVLATKSSTLTMGKSRKKVCGPCYGAERGGDGRRVCRGRATSRNCFLYKSLDLRQSGMSSEIKEIT